MKRRSVGISHLQVGEDVNMGKPRGSGARAPMALQGAWRGRDSRTLAGRFPAIHLAMAVCWRGTQSVLPGPAHLRGSAGRGDRVRQR